jgi:hypothetical protein
VRCVATRRLHKDSGTAVDHGIPKLSRFVIIRIFRTQGAALDLAPELFDRFSYLGRHWVLFHVLLAGSPPVNSGSIANCRRGTSQRRPEQIRFGARGLEFIDNLKNWV